MTQKKRMARARRRTGQSSRMRFETRFPTLSEERGKVAAELGQLLPFEMRIEPNEYEWLKFGRKADKVIHAGNADPIDWSRCLIYGSDVAILDGELLATLCVFYDQIALPYCSRKSWVLYLGQTVRNSSKAMEIPAYDVNKWIVDNSILFQHGVLRQMPPPVAQATNSPWQTVELARPDVMSLLGTEIGSHRPEYQVRADMRAHHMRKDLYGQQIFSPRSSSMSRQTLVASQATAICSYLMPGLTALNPEQILELRSRVSDTREGFMLHLQRLSRLLEQRVSTQDEQSKIMAEARALVEIEIVPDYREYRRQLSAERSGRWGKVLDRATKILEIDASPSTPKFWGQLLRHLGLTALTSDAESKDLLSNRNQAFQLMRIVEESQSSALAVVT